MALTRGFVQNSAMTPLDARFFTAGMLQKNLDNSVRLGQMWGSGSAVAATAASAPMTVTIADGTYWVVSRGGSDGAVILVNNGVASVNIPAAPNANSQYHAVWVKQNDSTQGDADSNPVFGVSSGGAAASPAVPAVPTGALLLATVLVPAGVTSTNAGNVVINNVFQFTALTGSPIRYRSLDAMRADIGNVVTGVLGYVTNSGLYSAANGVWRRLDGDIIYKTRQPASQSLASSGSESTLGTATTAVNSTSDPAFFPLRSDCIIGPLPVAGYYEIVAQLVWGANGTGSRYIELTQTDTPFSPAVEDYKPAMASGGTRHNLVAFEYFNAGDYIKLKGWQNSGAALTYAMSMTARLARP